MFLHLNLNLDDFDCTAKYSSDRLNYTIDFRIQLAFWFYFVATFLLPHLLQ